METVFLKPQLHRGQEYFGIYFKDNPELEGQIRKIRGVKWSPGGRCWCLPLSREYYDLLRGVLQGAVKMDITVLQAYLKNRKAFETESAVPGAKAKPGTYGTQPIKPRPSRRGIKAAALIPEVNSHVLSAMKQMLVLKGYSEATIRTYLNEMAQFLQSIKGHSADEFTTGRIKAYMQYCSEQLKLSEHTLHSRINALKFYYEQVLKRERFFWEIPRPRRPLQLPKVLSKEEVAGLIRAIENVKHRTMLMLAYGCGLRVSEIIRLRLTDVQEERRLLFIQRSKGKKDRVISLSPALLVMLRAYREQYKPLLYLFEGQVPGTPYSVRSLEAVVHTAKKKAGIKKSGSMHLLRHSFATHLLDKGTDVVFIQRLLGHNDIKTTLRYLHVTNKDLINIVSPLEDIKDWLD